jgi:hypothetical protein
LISLRSWATTGNAVNVVAMVAMAASVFLIMIFLPDEMDAGYLILKA